MIWSVDPSLPTGSFRRRSSKVSTCVEETSTFAGSMRVVRVELDGNSVGYGVMRVRFVPNFTDVHACTGGGTDDERETATATRDEDSEIPHVTEPVGWLLASCEHVPDSTRLDSKSLA